MRGLGGAPRPVLVGFAAETDDVVRKAREKRARKQVDLIVANDVSQPDRGFDAETNAVTIIGEDGEQEVPLQSKDRVAAAILDRVEQPARGSRARSARIPAARDRVNVRVSLAVVEFFDELGVDGVRRRVRMARRQRRREPDGTRRAENVAEPPAQPTDRT